MHSKETAMHSHRFLPKYTILIIIFVTGEKMCHNLNATERRIVSPEKYERMVQKYN